MLHIYWNVDKKFQPCIIHRNQENQFFKKKSHIPHRVTEWTDKVNHRSSFATKNGKYQYFSVSVFNFSCTVETYIYIYIIRTGNSIGLDQILCHDI